MNAEPSIEIEDLTISFPSSRGDWRHAVEGLTLRVGARERVGVVGESGSGKSLTSLAIIGLVPEPGRVTGGSVRVAGVEVSEMSGSDLLQLRGRVIGTILQEPAESLNPVFTTGFQIAETVAVHRHLGRADAARVSLSLLGAAAIDAPEEIFRAYPHQLSGGQAQRVMVALALAGKPRLLIADEPTSALDSLTRSQVIELLDRVVTERGMGLLVISHDLAVVASLVDRIAVMFAGRIVEEGPAESVFSEPLHPYTKMLLASTPGSGQIDSAASPIHGFLERSISHRGCRFADRCDLATDSCRDLEPDLEDLGQGRRVRCPVVTSGRKSEDGSS
ncbi:MAG: ABC transporter ATP-binding protein [Acidobacteria bacterium]|jgi:oligopeptide/dipeptide ABC transporter ATP-binding protein|nr:ABC transporter ATP-binding protein [Acidobacteriota bacterium]